MGTEPAEAADAALAAVLLPRPEGRDPQLLTRAQLAERTGIAEVVLAAVEREGLLTAQQTPDGPRYAPEEADAVRAGLALLEQGVPLGDLLALAREFDAALNTFAEHAVELFARYVRDPAQVTASSNEEAASRVVAALERMLPATGDLVSHRFRALLLASARRRLDDPTGA
ncbi:MAG TPA: hypothetical protein VGW10_19860 [Solirubrobacteraceae bacterium]|nr:hypothetical protein [Solirubrobacteraceae bacterium]